MNNNRPVFLNLFQMKMPVMAVVSFLHRVCGVILFLFLPWLIWLLAQSLASPEQFQQVQVMAHGLFFKLAMWALLSALGHHFFAGVRHIIMDWGYGESLRCAQVSSYVVIFLDIVWAVAVGVWLW